MPHKTWGTDIFYLHIGFSFLPLQGCGAILGAFHGPGEFCFGGTGVQDAVIQAGFFQDSQFSALALLQAGKVPCIAGKAQAFAIALIHMVADHRIQPAVAPFLQNAVHSGLHILLPQIQNQRLHGADNFGDLPDIGAGFRLRQVEAHHGLAHGILEEDAVEDIGGVLLRRLHKLPPFLQNLFPFRLKIREIVVVVIRRMSGGPIIQGRKLVGAVTHVLVNDPTRGYGVFIENMLEAAGKLFTGAKCPLLLCRFMC